MSSSPRATQLRSGLSLTLQPSQLVQRGICESKVLNRCYNDSQFLSHRHPKLHKSQRVSHKVGLVSHKQVPTSG